MDLEHELTFEEYSDIANDLKDYIDKEFTKEDYEQMMRVSAVGKKQKEAIEFLVDHYYDSLYPEGYNDKPIDRRFAYYDIIETCLKKLKETDKSFELLFAVAKEREEENEKSERN